MSSVEVQGERHSRSFSSEEIIRSVRSVTSSTADHTLRMLTSPDDGEVHLGRGGKYDCCSCENGNSLSEEYIPSFESIVVGPNGVKRYF